MAENTTLHSLFSGCSTIFEREIKKWMNSVDTAKQAVGFPYAFKSTQGVEGDLAYACKDGREIIGEIQKGSMFSRVEGCRFYIDRCVSPHLIHRPYYYTYAYIYAFLIIYGRELFGHVRYNYLHDNLVNCLERLMKTIHQEAFQNLQKAVIYIQREELTTKKDEQKRDRESQMEQQKKIAALEVENAMLRKNVLLKSPSPNCSDIGHDGIDEEKRGLIVGLINLLYAKRKKSLEERKQAVRMCKEAILENDITKSDIESIDAEWWQLISTFDDEEEPKLTQSPQMTVKMYAGNSHSADVEGPIVSPADMKQLMALASYPVKQIAQQ